MFNRRLTVYAALAVLAALVGTIIWFGHENGTSWRQPDDSSKPKLVIGVATWIGYGAFYIAQEKGFFAGEPIELKRIDDTAVYNSAMIKGDIDGFCNTMDSFVLAAGSGVHGKAVYLFDESAGADGVVAKPEIKSVADLKGKRVAAQTGWPGHFFLLYLTKKVGLKPTDYTFINLDADKAGAAFMSGDLDAAVTWEPWLSRIAQSGKGRILVSSRDNPGVIMDGLIISPQALQSKHDQVEAVVKGLFRAVSYWREHPAEGNAIVARNFKLSPDAVGRMIQGVHFLDQTDNQTYLKPAGLAAQTLTMARQVWLEAGVLKRSPEVSTMLTSEFVH